MSNKIMGTQLNNAHNESGKYLNMRITNYEKWEFGEKSTVFAPRVYLSPHGPEGVAAEASYAPHTFTHTTLA